MKRAIACYNEINYYVSSQLIVRPRRSMWRYQVGNPVPVGKGLAPKCSGRGGGSSQVPWLYRQLDRGLWWLDRGLWSRWGNQRQIMFRFGVDNLPAITPTNLFSSSGSSSTSCPTLASRKDCRTASAGHCSLLSSKTEQSSIRKWHIQTYEIFN